MIMPLDHQQITELAMQHQFEIRFQLTKIFELAFLLCKCIPCKCATSSSKRYQVYVQLRAQVFVIIDEIFVLEPATVILHRVIFKIKSAKYFDKNQN